MSSPDKKKEPRIENDEKKGTIRTPIEDLPSEWSEEDREIGGRKPDLGEMDDDPSEL